MDQEKFQSVKYVQGEGEAMMEANLPQFKKLTPLIEEEEYYEIEKYKKYLRMSLPIQIGYFILQYAKLRMLQFYYDFMLKFVSPEDFQYCDVGWLVDFGFNGPLRQYFSLYRAVSQREGERGKKG